MSGEFAVAVTDLALCIETAAFALILARTETIQPLLRRLLVWLFTALAVSSLLGAAFHAFFPLKDTVPAGAAMWFFVALSIGIVATVLLCVDALLFRGAAYLVRVLPLILAFIAAFAGVMLFLSAEFSVIIAFYAPPLALLAVVSARDRQWGIVGGVALSFVAAAAQYFQVILHPVYFNQNALYHVLQAGALAMLFVGFRRMLTAKPGSES